MTYDITEAHDNSAGIYDDMSERLEWHGHEALFGIAYEYVRPGESLLDIAIGTGLSSYLYHIAGLEVYGIDNSEKMMEICKMKGFVKGLEKYDLGKGNWPYGDSRFDHATACGLFHFYERLDVFFSEVSRIVKPNGTFSFTVMDAMKSGIQNNDQEYGIIIYGHNEKTIEALAIRYGFTVLKTVRLLAYQDVDRKTSNVFKGYLLKRQ